MATTLHGIAIPGEQIGPFCERRHVRMLSLFGSILTDRFRPESDIDILVEFEPDAAITCLDIARTKREMSEVFGRKVDMRTTKELSRYFRDRVVAEAVLQYERK